MYATQKNHIRNLTAEQFEALRQLCRLSKNLYNVALYSIRQYYFQEKKHLTYESNYHVCKTNENYQMLNTDIAQHTLKVADRGFKSFYALIQKCKRGDYRYQDVKMPKYLPKEDYFSLVMPRIIVKNGQFKIPMSTAFRKQYGEVVIPFPERLADKKIKEVRIHPRMKATYFEVEFVYEQPTEQLKLDFNKGMAVDFGLDNLATCCTSFGTSFIVDGKTLKSTNQWYNKENARLQSIKDKQGMKAYTKRQNQLTMKRNNQVRDYMNKTARMIVNYCIEHQIGVLVVGYNLDWKRNINIGKSNNQKFCQIPHGDLRLKLQNLCERYGIRYVEQEESYTSKASFFDNDELPIYNADNPQKHSFSGKRVSRGRYVTTNGFVINADCNGALNILRKSNLISVTALQDSGCLAQPLRIRVI